MRLKSKNSVKNSKSIFHFNLYEFSTVVSELVILSFISFFVSTFQHYLKSNYHYFDTFQKSPSPILIKRLQNKTTCLILFELTCSSSSLDSFMPRPSFKRASTFVNGNMNNGAYFTVNSIDLN